MIWSNLLGYVKNSLWLIFTIKGILCAYFLLKKPKPPNVVATALQPPSIANFTIFSGSK